MSTIYFMGLVRNAFGFVGFLKISLNIFSDNRKKRSHSSNMSILVEDALINAEKCRVLKIYFNWESNNAMRRFEFSLGTIFGTPVSSFLDIFFMNGRGRPRILFFYFFWKIFSNLRKKLFVRRERLNQSKYFS